MKQRSLKLILLTVFIGVTLGGCGCFAQQMKGEAPPPPPPAVVQPAPPPPPEPAPLPPPEPPPAKPDRN